MNAPTKLAAFGLGLLLAFGAAVGLGSAVGPIGPAAGQHTSDTESGQHTSDTEAGGHKSDGHGD